MKLPRRVPVTDQERQELADALARTDFMSFVQRCFFMLSPGTA